MNTMSSTDSISTMRFITSIIRGLLGLSGTVAGTVFADDIVMRCFYEIKTSHC